jgi:hypothetical protein
MVEKITTVAVKKKKMRVCCRHRESFAVREKGAGQAGYRRGRGLDGILQLQKRFAQGRGRYLRVGQRRTIAAVCDRL